MGSRAIAVRSQSVFRPTRGYAQIPNSIIENLALLTHAESCLVMVILRFGAGKPVSDAHWTKWTGLTPRSKERAIAGLTRDDRPAIIIVEGKGEKARFSFNPNAWAHHVRTADRSERAHTHGRKRGVAAPVGMKVHEGCRDTGCSRLQEEECELRKNFATPVSRIVSIESGRTQEQPILTNGSEDGETMNRQVIGTHDEIPPTPARGSATRVSRNSGAAAAMPKSLSVLSSLFPLAGENFLAQLVMVCSQLHGPVGDDELSEAIKVAYACRRGVQKTEGLFLLTVPEALGFVRKHPKQSDEPMVARKSVWRFTEGALEASLTLYKGSRLDAMCTDIESALAWVRSFTESTIDYCELESLLQNLDRLVMAAALDALDNRERAIVEKECASDTLVKEFRGSREQLADMKNLMMRRAALAYLKLPRLVM
jgi:hypothetical protein